MSKGAIEWTPLDMYDYTLTELPNDLFSIEIPVSTIRDLEVADISTEVTGTDGYIYLEGHYMKLIRIKVEDDPSVDLTLIKILARKVDSKGEYHEPEEY